MGRLWILLLLVVTLTVPMTVQGSARGGIRTAEASAAVLHLSAPSSARHMAMPCRGCTRKACAAYAIGCSADCAAASALLSLPVVLTAIVHSEVSRSISSIPEDLRIPPEPHPPRPIFIS